MRLVHLADLHLGYRQYQRQNELGINQREHDVAAAFKKCVEQVIALQPDLVLVAGDVFHQVRPSNPAIVLAFLQFARLVRECPQAEVIIIAGNHDQPRTSETGCILRLFAQLGIHVVDDQPRWVHLPERDTAVLAVPDSLKSSGRFEPDAGFRHNILLLHAEVEGAIPSTPAESAVSRVTPADLMAERWSYVALGHYHVHRRLALNACYSGALEYCSRNIWSEAEEERTARIPGKGFVEYDLESRQLHFHPLPGVRQVLDLPAIHAAGLAAPDVDERIRANVASVRGGIAGKIVRQVVWDIPRHIERDLDQRALREYRRAALHFHLDGRRPQDSRSGPMASGKRRALADEVREQLLSRPLNAGLDRQALVELGLRYLQEASAAEGESSALPPEVL
jgi:exonuclease SbcD